MTTPRINQVLENIRYDLEAQSAVWGPDTVPMPDTDFAQGQPGTGMADNESDAGAALDDFVYGVAKTIEDEFGLSIEDALDFVFDAAAELEGQGLLPAVPGSDADPGQIARWLGTAGTIGFGSQVLKAARIELSSGDDEIEAETFADADA